MDLKQFRAIAPGLDKEIADVCLKYGLKVGKRSGTVDPTEGTIAYRLTLIDTKITDKDGNPTTPEALRFAKNAGYMGMKAEWLNQTFKHGGKTYKVVGLRAGRSVMPVLVEIEGKSGCYMIPVEAIRTGFGLPKDRSLEELRTAAYASAD